MIEITKSMVPQSLNLDPCTHGNAISASMGNRQGPGTGTAMSSGESKRFVTHFTGMSSRKGARSATRRPCPEKASPLKNHAILEVFQNQLQPNVPQLCPFNFYTENDDHPPKIWGGPTNFWTNPAE